MSTLLSGAPDSPDEEPPGQLWLANFSRKDAQPSEDVGLELFDANAEPAPVYGPPCHEPQRSLLLWQRVVDAVILGRRWTPLWRVVVLAGAFLILISTLLICGAVALTMVLAPTGLLMFWCAFVRWSAQRPAFA